MRTSRVTLAVSIFLLAAPGAAAADEPPTCAGRAATIVGTEGDDILRGTDGRDVIVGLDGTDQIVALKGDDIICAGPNPLVVKGDPAEIQYALIETVSAGSGDDLVFGGPGFDSLDGSYGADRLSVGTAPLWPSAEVPMPQSAVGGHGDDIVTSASRVTASGGRGDDRLFGGPSHDTLTGGPDNDSLHGYAGLDALMGLRGQDRLFGGDGDDTLDAGAGRDENIGGLGSDWCSSPEDGPRARSCERSGPFVTSQRHPTT